MTRLKKDGVLARLKIIRAQAESPIGPPEDVIGKMIIDLLLDYGNDADIRKAVDEIPF